MGTCPFEIKKVLVSLFVVLLLNMRSELSTLGICKFGTVKVPSFVVLLLGRRLAGPQPARLLAAALPPAPPPLPRFHHLPRCTTALVCGFVGNTKQGHQDDINVRYLRTSSILRSSSQESPESREARSTGILSNDNNMASKLSEVSIRMDLVSGIIAHPSTAATHPNKMLCNRMSPE